jgi:hypothetical protein
VGTELAAERESSDSPLEYNHSRCYRYRSALSRLSIGRTAALLLVLALFTAQESCIMYMVPPHPPLRVCHPATDWHCTPAFQGGNL